MPIRHNFQRLVEKSRGRAVLAAAFVYPCDADSLQLALSGAFAGFLAPLLVGPQSRIRDVAERAGLDIARLPIVDTPDDPREAARAAIALACDRSVAALVKGSLGSDDLLAPVAMPESGLRGERRLSHAFYLDLPGTPHGILLADAQLNVTPSLAAKREIVQNTLDLAAALGIEAPTVAVLAALDVVSPSFASTADAAALRSMAAQGQFPGAIVDGPMTVDNALSVEAARANGVRSEVAGRADALIAPTMESALMVLRTLTALTGGLAAGIVLGAKVPIVAPARTDSMETRIASCVLASLLASAPRRNADGRAGAAEAPVAPGASIAARIVNAPAGAPLAVAAGS